MLPAVAFRTRMPFELDYQKQKASFQMFFENGQMAGYLWGKEVLIKTGKHLATAPAIFWLLPICAMLLSTRYILTNVDSSWYLVHGRMIADGHGYASDLFGPNIERGPLFPLIIAGVLHFWGIKLVLLGYITRAFYMFNLLILYGIGSRLYGRTAGFFVFFLSLTSFSLLKTTPYILLDHVLPFFILFSVFMMILAVQTTSIIIPLAGGLSLGLAYLTKESALMYLPLFCLLLLQRRFSAGKRLIRAGAAYIGFSLVTVPWIIHVFSRSPSIKMAIMNLMGGPGRVIAVEAIAQNTDSASLFDRLGDILNSIISYHTHTVHHDFAIAPLFLVGVVLLIVTLLIRKRFSGVEIVLAALLFTSPLNAHLGSNIMRTGQSITYYYLLLSACSSIIGCLVILFRTLENKIADRGKPYKYAAWGLPVLLAISIIAFQLHQEKGFIGAIQGKGTYGFRYYQSPQMEVTGDLGPAQLEAAKWLGQRMGPTDKALNSYTLWGPMTLSRVPYDQMLFILFHPGIIWHPKDYKLEGKTLPLLIIDPLAESKYLTLGYQRNVFAPYISDNDRPYYVFTLPSLPGHTCLARDGSINSNQMYYCGIWFFLENMFLNFINTNDVRYISVSHTESYLNEYLGRNPGFQLVFRDERETGSVSIYRVDDPEPMEEPFLMVGDQVPVYMERLKKYYPHKYERFLQEVLVDYLHLQPDQIHEILTGEGKTFKTY